MNEKMKTKVTCYNVPVGTVVKPNVKNGELVKGKTGMILCTLPANGGYYYREEDLEEV